jgi:ribose 5-phosphate isomerase B
MSKKLITEWTIVEASRRGEKVLLIDRDTIVTAAAQDRARQLGVRLENKTSEAVSQPGVSSKTTEGAAKGKETVAVGSDHGGFQLKEQLKPYLETLGYKVVDLGTYSEEACDYPDFAYAVARMVSVGDAAKGIMIDSVGSASAIVANKLPGIRAVCCFNEFSARSSREHNDANVLTLGGKVLGIELAKSIVKVWLETWFGGGRHQKRVDKISEIEGRFLKQ